MLQKQADDTAAPVQRWSGRRHLLPWRRKPAAVAAFGKKRGRMADAVIVSAGLGLGLVCAVFPWYIFLHQDRFGIHTLKPTGRPMGTPGLDAGPLRVGINWNLPDRHDASLDAFPTGTVDPAPKARTPPADQPFPGDKNASFDLVEVANGRAMIEDSEGFWLVRVGSALPDDSRVRSIERRQGGWVLVTTGDKVVKLTDR